jgi:hypothetical protein
LEKFHGREGHCRVPRNHLEGNLKLDVWVLSQRQKRDTLLPVQIQRLDQLGFSWDPLNEDWEANFAALVRFHARNGHCLATQSNQEGGRKIASWIINQRRKRDRLSSEQIKRLEQLGFSWNPLEEAWEGNFAALQKFKQREGHCRVVQIHQEDGLNLGSWVAGQRAKRDSLSSEQIERLDQLGFSWDPLEEAWEANFAALQKFKQREGHFRAAPKHKEDGMNLGSWVASLRTRKNCLPEEQIKQLDEIGFCWDPHGELWESNFAALQKFWQREGNCRVPRKHSENGCKRRSKSAAVPVEK